MNRRFLRCDKSRTGYIYPDNYIGAGLAPIHVVGGCNNDDVIGYYERAVVLGPVTTPNGDRSATAIRFLDLEMPDGSPVYGVIPAKELFFATNRSETYTRGMFAGNMITVSIEGHLGVEYTSLNSVIDAYYSCSRRKVLEDVQNTLTKMEPGDTVLGRICGRGKYWSYKIDVGGGCRVWLNERDLGKHSIHSHGSLLGSVLTLKKTADGDFEAISETFGREKEDLCHGALACGVLTRADGHGQIYAYIPNYGFIYVAGYVDEETKQNKPLHFTATSCNETIDLNGKTLRLGCVVQLEIVRNGVSVCGYIRSVMNSDAVSGCVIL